MPPNPPTPVPTPAPAQPPAGESWADYTAPTDSELSARDELRRAFAELGWDIDLPASLADLENTAKDFNDAQAQLDKLEQTLAAGGGPTSRFNTFTGGAFGRVLSTAQLLTARQKVQTLAAQLYTYAGEYFGSLGQTIVSRTLRPPVPDVTKLPTPEEFLGDYSTAYATHIEGMRKAGQLTSEEADFANNVMKNDLYQQYMARLGEFAKSGISPFVQKEISREERGIGAGTAAGAALDKALGPGVQEPTTVTGTGEEVSAAMDKAGQGVPKEFTSVARLSPLDFLSGNLSVTDIKVKYAGSPEGAGKTARRVPAGFVSNPRRV